MGAADVICGEDRLSMQVGKSKTDQEGRGKRVLVFAVPGSPLCPVVAVKGFLVILPDLF